jgi:hypothetical protein
MSAPNPCPTVRVKAHMHASRWGAAVAILLVTSGAHGQETAHRPPPDARLELADAGGVTIPIDVRSNLVYMRGRIDDSDSLWVVLDSGASTNALDADVARTIGLEIAEGHDAHGAGGTVKTGLVRDVTLRLPGVTLAGASFGTMDLGAFRLQSGRAMDVIVGHPLLSQSVVKVDYLARTLEILPAGNFQYRGRGVVIPLTFEQRLPYITARLTLPGRDPIEGRFVIDLGSSQALILSEPFVRRERVLETMTRTMQNRGRGVGGQVQSQAGRVTALEIAGLRLDGPITVMRTTTQGSVSAAGTVGNIGGDILRRFTVIFDYPHKRMILEPNPRFGDPFETDMAGFGMRMGPEGSGTIQVEWVMPESPAAEAGLQAGDLIERVDDRPALDVGIPGLREMFRRDHEAHRLGIRRDSTGVEITLTTRRMI